MAVIQTLKIVALLFVFLIQFKRNDTDLSESRLLWQPGSRRFVLKEEYSIGLLQVCLPPDMISLDCQFSTANSPPLKRL